MNYINFAKELSLKLICLVGALLLTINMAVAQTESEPDFIPPKIVVLGDSLVAGYQLGPSESFPQKLQKELGKLNIHVKITGAGVSGDTTSGGLARLNWSVPDGTDAVLLELGANDALRGLPPEKSEENLDSMIGQLLERDIRVLLIGMLAPPNMGEDYEKAFNPIYSKLAEKYDIPLYPFFLDGVLTKPELLLSDGMHPNAAGVDVMVRKICPMVERMIEDMRPAP